MTEYLDDSEENPIESMLSSGHEQHHSIEPVSSNQRS